MAALPEQQVPAIHHRRVSDIIVTAVSDGVLVGSMAVLQNIALEESSRMLAEAFRPVPRQTSINTFLVRRGDRVALIDTGCGAGMQDSAGKLFDNLAAAGVAPDAVDTVLLTHAHPDHSNALANAAGEALFPRATLAMHAAEWAYWNDDAAAARTDSSGQGVPYFPTARAQCAPYRDRLKLFRGGEVFPGVTALPLPGHTPGHTGFLIADGNETLLVWGDIVHVPEVQVPRPEVTMQFDVDPAAAAEMRRRTFDRAASDRMLVLGMHLHFPGAAHLVRENGGFRLVPEAWRQSL